MIMQRQEEKGEKTHGQFYYAGLQDSDDFTQRSPGTSTFYASVIWCLSLKGWLSNYQRAILVIQSCFLFWRHGWLLCELVMQTRSFWSPCNRDTVSWPVRDEVQRGGRAVPGVQGGRTSHRGSDRGAAPCLRLPLTSADRMWVNCSPFTSASRIHEVGLFYSQRERGRKPGEETPPRLRRQTTSRAKFCHGVASATGRDGSNYMFPSSHRSPPCTVTASTAESCMHAFTLNKSILMFSTPLPGSTRFQFPLNQQKRIF